MNEAIQNYERAEHPISGQQVERHLGSFVEQLQIGFQTEESRLEAYTNLISTTADFFNQPEVHKEGSHQANEARTLVDKYFYNHTTNVPVEIDFFEKAAEHVKKDILEPMRVNPLDTYWKDEIKLFGNLLRQEALNSNRALQDERHARYGLEALVPKQNDGVPKERDVAGTDEEQYSEAVIKNAVIEALEADPIGKAEITKIREYQKSLEDLLTGTVSAQEIESKLKKYRGLLGVEEGTSVYSDLLIRADRGHERYVKKKIQALLGVKNPDELEENPDFLWKNTVTAGLIPVGLYNSFEQLQTLAHLSDVAKDLADLPKKEKALALLPFIEQGISASLLYEIAEARFELPDEYVLQQVDAFLDFYSNYATATTTARHHRFGKTRKAAAALLAATILGMPLSTATTTVLEGIEYRSAKKTVEQIEEDITYSNEYSKIRNYHKPQPPTVSEPQTTSEPRQVGDSSLLRPENTPPGEFAASLGEVIWTIDSYSNSEMKGLFRTGTAAEFDPMQLGWKISKFARPDEDLVKSDYDFITVKGDKVIGKSQILELPVKDDYAMNTNDFSVDTSANYTLKQATDGSYFVQFGQEAVGTTVHIEYVIGESNYQTIPEPSDAELAKMSEVFITPDQLPNGELKNLVQALQEKTDYTPAMKAKILEIYIKKHFLYSLDPSVSNDYIAQTNVTAYLARIAEIQKGDCDVINTFYAMLLRSQGIPTRLAYGHAHSEGLATGDLSKLTAAEMHGWVEAKIGDGWITLDATPTTFDEDTREKLQNESSQRNKPDGDQKRQDQDESNKELHQDEQQNTNKKDDQDMEAEKQLNDILDKDKKNKDENEEDEEGNPIPSTLLALLTTSLLASGIAHFTRKRNDEIAANLEEEANTRLRRYIDFNRFPQEIVDNLWNLRDKIEPPSDFFRDFTGIKKAKALLGIVDALSEWSNRKELNKISLRNAPQIDIANTTDPDAVGMRVAMGEQKEVAEARIEEQEQDIIKRDVRRHINNAIWSLAEDSGDRKSFRKRVHFEVDALKEPQTEAEAESWENTTHAISEKLYKQYLLTRKARNLGRRIIPGIRRYKSKETAMGREQFDKEMHEIYTMKLVAWCIEREEK